MTAKKVLIIGDVMIDLYQEGSVSRISPEAPVPVVKLEKTYSLPGGAANVARNVAFLGGCAAVAGIVGNDENGRLLVRYMEENKIDTQFLLQFDSCHTVTKARILGNKQQIVRLDCYEQNRPSEICTDTLLQTLTKHISEFDVVVISDYLKGVCTERLCKKIIEYCLEEEKPIIVDPKGKQWDKYRGATIITPNVKEIAEYLGSSVENTDTDIEIKLKELSTDLGIKNILITRSELGMSLIRKEAVLHIPSRVREVFDVSGAGDTVVAALGIFWSDTEVEKSVRYANLAAGIVVGKRGTSAVTLAELNTVIGDIDREEKHCKILGKVELLNQILAWKKAGNTVVFTNGCFDILHKGHIYLMQEAAALGNKLVVAINSDKSIKRLKGKDRPVNCEEDRAYVLAALSDVDAVIIFDEDTPKQLLEKLKPDVLVKGGDYQPEQIIGREYVKRVKIVPYVKNYSTTETIQRLGKKHE